MVLLQEAPVQRALTADDPKISGTAGDGFLSSAGNSCTFPKCEGVGKRERPQAAKPAAVLGKA